MEPKEPARWNIDTDCIHAGSEPDPVFGAVAPPIYQTSTFAFETPEQGAARFAGQDPGFVYTRMASVRMPRSTSHAWCGSMVPPR
ncbi:MAG: PLP-dependent transferase [Gemmatimonadota bacterium]